MVLYAYPSTCGDCGAMHEQQVMDSKVLRQEIEELIASGNEARALELLSQLWAQNPDSAVAGFVLSCFERLRTKLSLFVCRIALLRSFTLEPCIPLLRAASAVRGIDVVVHIGDFNTYVAETRERMCYSSRSCGLERCPTWCTGGR